MDSSAPLPPRGPFASLLIPDEPRRWPGQRTAKIVLRALHVLCTGIYCGAYVFAIDPELRQPWFFAALLSGLFILLADLYESGAFLFQVRGLVVLSKLVVLALIPTFGPAAPWVLGVVVMVSVISSHAPSGFRYFLLWGRGRIHGSECKG